MGHSDSRLDILERARDILADEHHLTPAETQEILKLLQVLIEIVQQRAQQREAAEQARQMAAELIQNQNLLLIVKQQADELDALRKLSLNLTSSLDLPTVLEAVVSEAMRLVEHARTVNIFLYTDGKLRFGAALDREGERGRPYALPRPNGLTYTVAQSAKQVIIEDMSTHPLYQGAPRDREGSIIGIPLKVSGRVVGVMNVSKSTTGGFQPSELRLLELLADQAAIAISNASLHQLMSHQAYSDTLTGLPNRRALDDRLEQEVRRARHDGYTFAVVMMDLDGFKVVNDTYGHAVGDRLLRLFSNYLARGLRSTDVLARYGGDELTLILSPCDIAAAQVVVGKLVEKVKRFSFPAPDGKRLQVGISSGIAVYPLHALTAADLLRAADAALYRAKRHHRGFFALASGPTGELNRDAA